MFAMLHWLVPVSFAYEIGCLYPPEMPDPLIAQDIMIKYTTLDKIIAR